MRMTKSKIVLHLLVMSMFRLLNAQGLVALPEITGGAYDAPANDAAHPCITPAEYAEIERVCNENATRFVQAPKSLAKIATPALIWPLQAANGLLDCSFYRISAHVDEDSVVGQVKDYNCGSATYDGHRGTDIATYPFPFYKMDNSQVDIVAAADGTILFTQDGNTDRNCAATSNPLNGVVVQHSDGSRTMYYHMKMNSVTTKAPGQTVVAGEYLGQVGSSGSSSGPHCHFEVWSGNTVATLKDPFSGNCNHFNAASLWAAQKVYKEPAIVKASVHTTDAVLPPCPTTETPNETTQYAIPYQGPGLPAGFGKFYIFVRYEMAGTTIDMRIVDPNGGTFVSWARNCTVDYNASTWGYSKLLPTVPGIYTFEATYNGATCAQTFEILNPTGIPQIRSEMQGMLLYPNPAQSAVNVEFAKDVVHGILEVYNAQGQVVQTIGDVNGSSLRMPRGELAEGMYFVRLLQDNAVVGSARLLLKD
jgi:murein DD-endopeptidase MepM/ murein hydrolase activator NlpD